MAELLMAREYHFVICDTKRSCSMWQVVADCDVKFEIMMKAAEFRKSCPDSDGPMRIYVNGELKETISWQ